MARFRLGFLASLARQMAFVPAGVREKQLQAAESLLLSVDPAKAYPPSYVIFRITAYRPELPPSDLVTGLALQHDLGLLIEQVSKTLDERVATRSEVILQIDDLVTKFNVTSKTIQRWRRRGLAARQFIFPDGKRRVGFRLSIVDQFFSLHGRSLQAKVNCSVIEGLEVAAIVRRARLLAADPRRPGDEIAARVGRAVGRSSLAVEAELRRHDVQCPNDAVLLGRPLTVPASAGSAVRRLSESGLSIGRIAVELDLPVSTAYRLLLSHRLDRITKRRIKFLDDPLYHQADAEVVLEHLLSQDPILETPTPPLAGGREVSSELRPLCNHPVLTASQERALFLQFNFRKFQAALACRRLDPARAGRRHLARIERFLSHATDVRNRIVRANLRLVVSVAKKHMRPNLPLAELVNEGSLTLMRAVESFDTRKGHKFSTYATLALMKGFARLVGRNAAGPVVFGLNTVVDRAASVRPDLNSADTSDKVDRLLASLQADERWAVCRQFGLNDDASSRDEEFAAPRFQQLCRSGIKKMSARHR